MSPQNRRCRGHSPEDAQDLTQEFFAHVLHKGCFHLADRTRGRFRTFLVHALEHFLINEWKRGHAPLAWALPRAFVGRGRSDGRSAGQRGRRVALLAQGQLCQPDESTQLDPHSGSIGAMAISEDGKRMAAHTGADKIALWDLATKRKTAELPGSASIRTLALSAAGDRLAVSTRNARGEPTIEVWDANVPALRSTLHQLAPLRSLAPSPEGALLATFDERGGIALIDWVSNLALTNFSVRGPRSSGARRRSAGRWCWACHHVAR